MGKKTKQLEPKVNRHGNQTRQEIDLFLLAKPVSTIPL